MVEMEKHSERVVQFTLQSSRHLSSSNPRGSSGAAACAAFQRLYLKEESSGGVIPA